MSKEQPEVKQEVQEEVQATETQETAVATTGETAVVSAPKPTNYIVQILHQSMIDFLEVNEGMDLDYVRAGDWLKLNKKGNYVDAGDDSISYGDVMDVVVGQGEKRYMLWGADGSPEKGELIVAEKTEDEARAALSQWMMDNPERAQDYDYSDISLRYLAYLVPVKTLSAEDTPLIYLFDFPKGDTIGWGKFAKAIFDGKYKAQGVPKRTPVNRVVVRFTSEERENSEKESYLGTKFDVVGLFNPADYGIETDGATQQ